MLKPGPIVLTALLAAGRAPLRRGSGEKRIGSIEVGDDASLTVLMQSPHEVEPEKPKGVRVRIRGAAQRA